MNQLRNNVQLIGNLGATPQLHKLAKGKCYTCATIATNEVYYKKDGEKMTKTQWHRLVLWGNVAQNFCDLTEKGSCVAITGKLQSSTYKEENGAERYITEVNVLSFMLFASTTATKKNSPAF